MITSLINKELELNDSLCELKDSIITLANCKFNIVKSEESAIKYAIEMAYSQVFKSYRKSVEEKDRVQYDENLSRNANSKIFISKLSDDEKLKLSFAIAHFIDTLPQSQKEAEIKAQKRKESKDKASFIGLKALKGTTKQKDWANKIRLQKIEQLNYDCEPSIFNSDKAIKAAFWIDNRFLKIDDIIAILVK